MKKIIAAACGCFIVFVGIYLVPSESCACFKPSDTVKMHLREVRDKLLKQNKEVMDFSNVCTSTTTKAYFGTLTSNLQPFCFAEKDNFTLQVKLSHKRTLCVDVDSSSETYFLHKGATSCK
ncbi:MAG: hypothetical protein V4686_02465 [Patescibacteria group bacterium]